MKVIADLHIHSKYARACSKQISTTSLEKHARMKGLTLLGTGDAQHPKWLAELKQELQETEQGSGIYKTRTGFPFVLQTELSLMYSQNKKGRRVHNIILIPSFEVADQIVEALQKKGRLDYDGRPIFNMSCVELVEMMKSISKDVEIIPAHAWTPWFGLFGSKSGFDSLKEAFQDQARHVHAIETGLSSDPAMNWRLSELDNKSIVSFSDAHSHWPWRIGREATVFEMKKLTYADLVKAIRENKIVETIEFYPEEGKYHYTGHRECNVRLSPKQALKLNNTCPVCKKQLTIGVLQRVEELADRPEGFKPKNAKPYRKIVPISEIISWHLKSPVYSKKVWTTYSKLIENFGNELTVINAPEEKLALVTSQKIARAITNSSKLKWSPGYDGEYGKPVFEEKPVLKGQTRLNNF